MSLFSQPLLVVFSTMGFLHRVSVVMCCATLPVGQGSVQLLLPPENTFGSMQRFIERRLEFEVSSFTIPVTMAYSTNTQVLEKVPGMSSSANEASTIINNYIENEAREVIRRQASSMGLMASQMNTVIEQLSFSSSYTPLQCPNAVHYPGEEQNYSSTICVVTANTVNKICNTGVCSTSSTGSKTSEMLSIPSQYTTWRGTLSVANVAMANWTRQQWQSIFNQLLQRLKSGVYGINFGHAALSLL